MLEKDVFNRTKVVKSLLTSFLGLFFYFKFKNNFKIQVEGAELFQKLPDKNVLIISNHHTYFADVAFMLLAIQSAKLGFPNSFKLSSVWKQPKRNLYFVAAVETMKDGLLPRLMGFVGGILIKRTWREKGKEINRKVDTKDTDSIRKGLENGWIISFPQGTTKENAPIRKGTAHIIKNNNPIIVPIVIEGFRKGLNKKGLKVIKKGQTLRLRVKEPIQFSQEQPIEEMIIQIGKAIEQEELVENE